MDNDTQKENDSHNFARIDYEEMKEHPGAFLHFRIFTGTFPKVSDPRQPIVSFQFLDERGRRHTKFVVLDKAKAKQMGEALLQASEEC